MDKVFAILVERVVVKVLPGFQIGNKNKNIQNFLEYLFIILLHEHDISASISASFSQLRRVVCLKCSECAVSLESVWQDG